MKCHLDGKYLWTIDEASPSVVFVKDLEIVRSPKTTSDDVNLIEDENAKVDGTGSGFIWDNFGHNVTNHHVVAKLATDGSGIHCCKIYLADTRGNGFYREGKIVGVDPEYDLAVLKPEVNIKNLDCIELSRKGLKELQEWMVDNWVPRNC
uniref:Uncharacterized protein n=1 Tax=Quercus lobata TaxID=97700 RepID=A0A7N2LQ13_QUELO